MCCEKPVSSAFPPSKGISKRRLFNVFVDVQGTSVQTKNWLKCSFQFSHENELSKNVDKHVEKASLDILLLGGLW